MSSVLKVTNLKSITITQSREQRSLSQSGRVVRSGPNTHLGGHKANSQLTVRHNSKPSTCVSEFIPAVWVGAVGKCMLSSASKVS